MHYLYIHIGMNECVKHYSLYIIISTQNIVCSQHQMNAYIISPILWAYNQQIKQQNIWSVQLTSIRKENRSSQCLSYKEQWGRKKGKKGLRVCVCVWGGGGGGGTLTSSKKDWAEIVWVYKIGLKWPDRGSFWTWFVNKDRGQCIGY